MALGLLDEKGVDLLDSRACVRWSSASIQPRVSVNWWKRTALPSSNLQTWANGMSSGLPVPLARAGVAADHDHVVVPAEDLGRRGVEVLPPLLVERVEHGCAHRGQALVDAAVRQALGLVPDDRVVHHGQRPVEVAA